MNAPAAKRPRRLLVAWICALASLLGFAGCFAVWVNRQVLDAGNWSNTSGEVLEDPRVERALGAYLVGQLFAAVDVESELRAVLPKAARGLSAPVAAGLRALADREVPRLLASPAVHDAWRRANRTAVSQLIKILDGGGSVLSTREGVVALNLRPLIVSLAAELGFGNQLEAAARLGGSSGAAAARAAAEAHFGLHLPPHSGTLVIMRSEQLKTAQDIAVTIRGLAILLPLATVLMFALAVWLAVGWRRIALRRCGFCLFAIGALLLVARRVAGEAIVESLVRDSANRPAGEAVWSIGTSLLRNLAVAVAVYGLLLVLAAWLAGPSRPAVLLRRGLAPRLRDHAASAYLGAAVLLLLIVLWGPTPATRKALPVLGLAILMALGLTALRRQTAREFPQAAPGDALASLRAGIVGLRELLLGTTPGASPAPQGTAAGSESGERPPLGSVADEPKQRS